MKQFWLTGALRHPYWTLAWVLTLAFLMAFGAKNLYFRGDFRIFFSPENPQMQAFDKMQARFNKSDNMLVAITPASGDVFDPKVLAVVKELTDAAWQTPHSLRVDSITNFQHTAAVDDDLQVEDLLLDLSQLDAAKAASIKAIALAEPALVGRLVSHDSSMTAINITVQLPEKDQNQEVSDVYNSVRALTDRLAAAHPDLTFYHGGVIALNNAFSTEAKNDASSLVPIMFVVIVLMLAFMLRSALAAAAVVIIIVLTIAATLGLAGWAGVFLSTATVNVPTIVMTLAVADSVHLIASSQFLLRQGLSKPDAIAKAVQINAMPVLITSVTTAVGFLTLNFSEVPILRDLGNMTAVGVMLAWLFTMLLLPALLIMFPISHGYAEPTDKVTQMDRLADWVIRHHKAILPLTALLTLVAGWLMLQNKVNDEAVKYFSPATEYRQSVDILEEKLGGVSLIDFAVDSGQPSGVNDPAFIKAIAEFAAYLQSQPEVTHVSTISDVFKRLNKNMNGDDPAFYRLPGQQDEAAQYLLMFEMSLPFGLDLNNQLDLDKQATKVAVALKNMGSTQMLAFEQKGRSWMAEHYPQYSMEAASTALMFAHIGERNMTSMIQSLPLAMLIISALLVLSLKSWRLGAISLIPNLVPAVIGFGLWKLWSGEINLGLSVVASMSLGIIVDDTVHFLAKYKIARDEGRDTEQAIRYAFHSVGHALLITTVVLVFGFSVLILSNFRLNSDMGLLTGMIIVVALIIDLLFLPAFLLQFDRSKKLLHPLLQEKNTMFNRKMMVSAMLCCSLGLASLPSLADDGGKGLTIAQERKQRDEGWVDSESKTTMVLRNAQGAESTREIRTLSLEIKDEGDKGLTIFDEPKDVRGTAFLNHSHVGKPDDQWLYLPAVKRVKRIASRNKSGPFMGSEFAYEDLSSFELDKFKFNYLRDETLQDLPAFVVEQTPTDEFSGYSKTIAWIDQKDYKVLKVEYYDKKNTLLKTLQMLDYQLYLNKFWRPLKLSMVNHQTGKSTDLLVHEIQFGKGRTEADFDTNALMRAK